MRFFLASLLLLTVCQTAYAADLLSIYRLALSNDPQLQAAVASRAASAEARPLALAQLLPNLSASGNLTYQDIDVKSSPIGTSDDNFQSSSTGLNLVQPIFRRDRMIALQQADTQIVQADADLAIVEQALMLRVAQAYFDSLSAADTLEFAQSEKIAIERQLEQAKQRFEVGLIAITGIHESQARFDQARASEIAARNALDNANESLQEIIGQAPGVVKPVVQKIPLSMPEPAEIDAWNLFALEHNPGIQSARRNAELAKQTIAFQRSGHLPTLDLVGSYNLSRTESRTGSDLDSSSIGLQLAVPLYLGGGVSAATRQAHHQYEAARQGVEQQQRLATRQVKNAYRGVESSISRVNALGASIVSAQSALDATEAGLEVGTRTLVDVLNGQRDLFRAKRDYADARYDYILNSLTLKQAAGVIAENDLVVINGWLQ